MPQVLKDDVRDQIITAALQVFSTHGFLKTRMNDIAEEAQVSTGNLYRYFKNKEEVFDHVFPIEFVEMFLLLFRKRVIDLGKSSDWTRADANSEGAAKDLLEFMIGNRERSLILLKGSDGTPYAHIRDTLVDELTKSALNYVKGLDNKKGISKELSFIVREVLSNTISTMSNTLQSNENPAVIRNSFDHFWRYHLAGLQALLKK